MNAEKSPTPQNHTKAKGFLPLVVGKKVTTSPRQALVKQAHRSNGSPKSTEKIWRLWFRLVSGGVEYDYVPIDIDCQTFVHDLKKKILTDDNFDFHGIKLYLMKLYRGSSAIDPRSIVYDVLDNGDEVDIKLSSMLSLDHLYYSSTQSTTSSSSVVKSTSSPLLAISSEEEVNKVVKKEIGKLKKELAAGFKGTSEKKKNKSSKILESELNTLASRLENIEQANARRHAQFLNSFPVLSSPVLSSPSHINNNINIPVTISNSTSNNNNGNSNPESNQIMSDNLISTSLSTSNGNGHSIHESDDEVVGMEDHSGEAGESINHTSVEDETYSGSHESSDPVTQDSSP
eukprot:TRINITY_DN801_c0_g2_i1.p1 TRINITY_DN801_c0_g2~~TRINITY_DN801_c0_g2_i1.p1  ORF type:complete len:345 (-),score=67.06 TRINITY_DN801_c0_g2_i1:151-1185(-)